MKCRFHSDKGEKQLPWKAGMEAGRQGCLAGGRQNKQKRDTHTLHHYIYIINVQFAIQIRIYLFQSSSSTSTSLVEFLFVFNLDLYFLPL